MSKKEQKQRLEDTSGLPDSYTDYQAGGFLLELLNVIVASGICRSISIVRIGNETLPLFHAGEWPVNHYLYDENFIVNSVYRAIFYYDNIEQKKQAADLRPVIRLVSATLGRLKNGRADNGAHSNLLSPFLLKKQTLLRKIAISGQPVLIKGPTGTGKNFLAKYLHQVSGRSGSMVVVDSSSIPESLFETELFGFTEGSFTDSGLGKRGKIDSAQNGTVFFDKIDHLSIVLQLKLLRLLQDGSYTPVGSSVEKKANCCFIASVGDNIEDLVSSGIFREDLFYRLNVFPIQLPPINDRLEDIQFFIDKFIEEKQRFFGEKAVIEKNFLLKAEATHWPGNIRELNSFLERCYLMLSDRTLRWIDEHPVPDEASGASRKSLKEALNQCKKKHIHDILLECEGNQTLAAQVLEIQRTYLSRLIKEWSIKI